MGEFGCNFTLYHHQGVWLAIDCGMGFAEEEHPGIDLQFPDPSHIAALDGGLTALVLTHAHEDHLGAVAQLWPRLKCPVYATAFTLAVLKPKLEEAGIGDRVPLHRIEPGATLSFDPFAIDLVTITHSIPEPNLLRLRTPLGNIVHTGDWKLDPGPVIGPVSDVPVLRQLGEEGVAAVIGDSTNAMTPGRSVSEEAVRDALMAEFGKHTQRIAVCCFASNIARIDSIARAAVAHGRTVALVGRSLHRMVEAARSCGFLHDLDAFADEREAGYLPRERTVLIATGSQGEPRSAMPRIANQSHPHIDLEAGDTVLFSSRAIPGNEKAILRMQNRLIARGISVVTDHDAPIHASGHPARDEIAEMYGWLKPEWVIPVHGEEAHLHAHAALARELGCRAHIPANGSLLRLLPGPVEEIGTVETGKLLLDGKRLIPHHDDAVRIRRKLGYGGAATVSLAVDVGGRLLAPPQLTAPGLLDGDAAAAARAGSLDVIREAIAVMPPAEAGSDAAIEAAVARALRRHLSHEIGKKPIVEVHVLRLEAR